MYCIIFNQYVLVASEVPMFEVRILKPSGDLHRSICISQDNIGAMVIDTLRRHDMPMPTNKRIAGVGVNLLTYCIILESIALCQYGNSSIDTDLDSLTSYMHENHAYFCDIVLKSASDLPPDSAVRQAQTWQS